HSQLCPPVELMLPVVLAVETAFTAALPVVDTVTALAEAPPVDDCSPVVETVSPLVSVAPAPPAPPVVFWVPVRSDPPVPPEPIPPEPVVSALPDSLSEPEPPDPSTVLDSVPLGPSAPVPASSKRSVEPASNAGPLHPRANSVRTKRFTCHLAS